MIRIAAVDENSATAARLRELLTQAGYEVAEKNGLHSMGEETDTFLALISPAALADTRIRELLDSIPRTVEQYVVPLAVQPGMVLRDAYVTLPVIDLTADPDLRQTRAALDAALLSQQQLQPHRPERTAAERGRANLALGLVAGVAALIMFGAGLYAVGVMGIQAPIEEYNSIDTEVALTRDIIARPELDRYAQFIPSAAQQATGVDFIPTLRAVPTAYRPLVARTATAYAQGTPLPPTVTPEGM